jgi:hypothetical protein
VTVAPAGSELTAMRPTSVRFTLSKSSTILGEMRSFDSEESGCSCTSCRKLSEAFSERPIPK